MFSDIKLFLVPRYAGVQSAQWSIQCSVLLYSEERCCTVIGRCSVPVFNLQFHIQCHCTVPCSVISTGVQCLVLKSSVWKHSAQWHSAMVKPWQTPAGARCRAVQWRHSDTRGRLQDWKVCRGKSAGTGRSAVNRQEWLVLGGPDM